MQGARAQLFEWVQRGHLQADDLPRAIALAAPGPDGASWRHFLATLGLSLGAVLLAAGVIFFFAYNWDELGRLAKLALVQAALLGAVVVTWVRGFDKPSGRAALLASSLLTGAVFAVFGQVYQTGADPYQLFALWALLITPWALAGRQAWLWLMWIALLNLALVLYLHRRPGWLSLAFDTVNVTWALFILNTLALVAWECLAAAGLSWLRAAWARCLVALASGSSVTLLAFWAVIGTQQVGLLAIAAYLAWMAVAYWYYRYRQAELFVLAAGVLGAIIIVATVLARLLLDHGDSGEGYLLIAIVVIGLSAAGAAWLRRVAVHMQAAQP